MKLMFVVGGSYKSFYINHINKINKIDLLIFHQDIFYDFEYAQEKSNPIVSKELISLNQKFKCPILVYGIFIKNNIKRKCFILCINSKVSIIDCSKDIYLYIKRKLILVSNNMYNRSKAFVTISIINESINYENIKIFNRTNHFICNKKGVLHIKNGKIYKKFRKCCYFTLKKN